MDGKRPASKSRIEGKQVLVGNHQNRRTDTTKLYGRIGCSGQIIGDDCELNHVATKPLAVDQMGTEQTPRFLKASGIGAAGP